MKNDSAAAKHNVPYMRNAFRLLPVALLAASFAGCGGGGGYGSPATVSAPGTSPLSIFRGNSFEVDAFAGATPYSYNITSTNSACATGTAATPANSAAYGVQVTVPAAAPAGCTAVLSVNFTQAGSTTPALVDQIFVLGS
jgi:hypothetical protein